MDSEFNYPSQKAAHIAYFTHLAEAGELDNCGDRDLCRGVKWAILDPNVQLASELLLAFDKRFQCNTGEYKYWLENLLKFFLVINHKDCWRFATSEGEQILKLLLQRGGFIHDNHGMCAARMIARHLSIHYYHSEVTPIVPGNAFEFNQYYPYMGDVEDDEDYHRSRICQSGVGIFPKTATLPLSIEMVLVGMLKPGQWHHPAYGNLDQIIHFLKSAKRCWNDPLVVKCAEDLMQRGSVIKALNGMFPLKLQSLCRIAVLSNLAPFGLARRVDFIDKLMLPDCLKSYLKLEC